MSEQQMIDVGLWLLGYGSAFMFFQVAGLLFGKRRACITKSQEDEVFNALQQIRFVAYDTKMIALNSGFITDSEMPTVFPYYYHQRNRKSIYIFRGSRLHKAIDQLFKEPPEHCAIIDKDGLVVKIGNPFNHL